MAHEDAVGHASADDQYLETPPGATYEHTDAHVWVIVKFLMWLAVSAVVIHIGVGFLYGLMISQSAETGEVRYPLAAGQENRLPPTPRLQQFPRNEIYDFRQSEQDVLNGYGWMNREAGTVHIPIEQAMRLTLERGMLSSRPVDAAAQPPAPAELMPADSSSGRTLERRGR
jgi:hypothetical protein